MKTESIINLIFDANRGSVSQLSREGVVGEAFGQLPTPQRRGYTFCGWYCDGALINADTIIETDEDIRLVARWEKSAAVVDTRRSMLKRQKIAIAVLAAVSIALIITFVIVAQLITIYSFVDTYTIDGVEYKDKYYVKRHEGVYKLFDDEGTLMDTNGVLDTVFIASGSGNQYKIDPDTGAHTLRAVVDTEGIEVPTGSSLLVFPQLLSANVYSIQMENEQGANYTIFRTGDGIESFKVKEFEDSKFDLDQELITQLCFSCGYLLSNRKIGANSQDPNIPRLEDGSIDYSVYGLDTPQATYTISGILLKKGANGKSVIDYDAEGKPQADPQKTYTIHVGDAILSGGGYYVKLADRDSVYIITTSYFESTVLQPLESLVVPRAVYPVSVTYHSMVKDFALLRASAWDQTEGAELVAAFTYSEIEERINTIDSLYPYITPADSVMAGYKINTDSAFAVLEAFYSLEAIACRRIGLTPETFAEFGFDKDVYWLTYKTFTGTTDEDGNKQYIENKLYIGPKTPQGTYYVAAVPFNMIVEVDQAYLSFLEWDDIKWYDDAFTSHNIAYIRDINFKFGDQEYNFTLDNTLSYAYYKSGSSLKAVDISKGIVYVDSNTNKPKYKLNDKVYDIIIINWDQNSENAVQFVTQKDIIENPNLENVIYVKETFYYVNEKGENVGVSPNYNTTYIEYELESGYYYYVDKTTEQRIRVQRSLGDPIYQYKKGLEVTLGIDAKNLKVFCDQYTKNESESGLLDYVIEQSGMGDDGIYKTETRTAFENFKKLHLQLIQFSLMGDMDEEEEERFQAKYGVTIEEFLKQGGQNPTAEIKISVEDYAKFFNGYTRYEDGKEVQQYDKNNEQYFVYKFYKYTGEKALVTVELFEKDENGQWVSTAKEGVVGKFFVASSVLNKLEKDINRLLNQEFINSDTKH